ncbi:MAG: dockerin type I domain-containing protein, partial [Ruminococcus sp.]
MKRFTSLIIAILLFSSVMLTVSAYSDSEFSNGDVDLDGQLSIRDTTDIQKYLAEKLLLTEQQMRLADFNLDGEVNIRDTTNMQKVIAKIEEMPTESSSTTPTKEYVTPEEFGLAPDTVDEMCYFQKALDSATELGLPLDLEGKTYYIYTSEARCPIINGTLKIMPSSSLVLTGNNVSLNSVNISRWWDGDGYEYGDVRLHLTDGCVIENCNFSAQTGCPRIFCNTEASNTTIRNCTFSEGFGILFNDGVPQNRKYNDVLYTSTIGKGLYIDNCTFNTQDKAAQYAGDNIEVNTPNHRFSDVRVTNCTSYGAKEGSFMGIGFGFAQVDNLVCSENVLYNIEGPGAIHMEGCTDVESKNN